MASPGIRRSRLSPGRTATVVAGIIAPIVAGCATVPSSSAPRPVLNGANAVQAYVRPLPPPPPSSGLYTSPLDIVRGFLAASATYAYDPSAANQFLSPRLGHTWRPGPVTVVSSLGQEITQPDNLRLGSSPPAKTTTVRLTVQHLATLSQTGQYEYSAGTSKLAFTLAKQTNGVWLIIKLPRPGHNLLLTQTSFQEVYQPRNLFFFARQEPSVVNGELVPDPVYAPVQSENSALNTDVAAGLVKGLLNDQGSWLSHATTTAFPRGTTLLKVALRGQVAVVDLGGTAARASGQQKNDMYAQLRATLTSNAYSNPLAGSVVMQIDGRTQYSNGNFDLVSQVSTGSLVYQSGIGTVGEQNQKSSVAGPAQLSSAQITALAASASSTGSAGNSAPSVPAVAVAVADGGGCAVETPVSLAEQPGGPYTYKSHQVSTSGPCTSLSWDRNGNLWAVADGRIMELPWRGGKFLTVSSPVNLPSDGKSGGRIISLQMAPDGVRAALLVKTSLGNRVRNRVLLAAVTNVKPGQASLGAAVPAWTALPDPTALSWYSPYDLVVLTRTGIWQVPLTGGAGRLLGSTPAGAVAVSLASDGKTLAVGTEGAPGAPGAVYTSSNRANSWTRIPAPSAAFPTYPSLELGAPVSGAH